MPPKKLGSSPQVRGKRVFHTGTYNVRRLIPAGAGKTIIQCVDELDYAAHPRRCGENFVARCVGFVEARLIPAGAGKTLADMELYPHKASFRISLEPKASINPT